MKNFSRASPGACSQALRGQLGRLLIFVSGGHAVPEGRRLLEEDGSADVQESSARMGFCGMAVVKGEQNPLSEGTLRRTRIPRYDELVVVPFS